MVETIAFAIATRPTGPVLRGLTRSPPSGIVSGNYRSDRTMAAVVTADNRRRASGIGLTPPETPIPSITFGERYAAIQR